jgi:hypothetical protein
MQMEADHSLDEKQTEDDEVQSPPPRGAGERERLCDDA